MYVLMSAERYIFALVAASTADHLAGGGIWRRAGAWDDTNKGSPPYIEPSKGVHHTHTEPNKGPTFLIILNLSHHTEAPAQSRTLVNC